MSDRADCQRAGPDDPESGVGQESMRVAWPSASNSVQSMATLMLVRDPPRRAPSGAVRHRYRSPRWTDSSRSTCLIACLVVSPRANARPCPIVLTAREPVLMTPRVAPAFAGAGYWPATQRAWHACHRRTGRQASGEPVQTRGAVAVASPGPANRGCRRDDSRFVSFGQRFAEAQRQLQQSCVTHGWSPAPGPLVRAWRRARRRDATDGRDQVRP
jgi:hypothetical protein